MYLPPSFREDRREALHELIRQHPLATLVAAGAAGMEATPVPLLLDTAVAPSGVLRAHLARVNPVLAALAGARACLAIFRGPEAYVTPTWYPSKRETGRVVPTWNYVAVHVHGIANVIDDPAWIRAQIDALTMSQEARRIAPWAPADAPNEYLDAQLRAIVGVEIAISRIDGKWKMSQNRNDADRLGVVAGLRDDGDPHADSVVADLVEARSRRS